MIRYDNVEKVADLIGKRVIVDGDYEWMAESTIDEEFGRCDYSSTITVTNITTNEKVLLTGNQHLDAGGEYDPEEDEEVCWEAWDACFDINVCLARGDVDYQRWCVASQTKQYMIALVLGDHSVFAI